MTATRSIPACATLLSLFGLAGCGEDRASGLEVEQLHVIEGGHSLELEQRFDRRGELDGTRIAYRARGSAPRELHVSGALLTGRGATAGGALLRTFLRGVPPALLARLHEADVRYDVAVLTADVLLGLAPREQRTAARVLRGEGALCALLGACASAREPGRT